MFWEKSTRINQPAEGSSLPGSLCDIALPNMVISFFILFKRDFIPCAWGNGLTLVASVVSDSATPWTVASHAPRSLEFFGQEYQGGLPFPTPGNVP